MSARLLLLVLLLPARQVLAAPTAEPVAPIPIRVSGTHSPAPAEGLDAVAASCWAPCPSPRWVFKAGVPSRFSDGVEAAAAGIGGGRIFVSHGKRVAEPRELRIYDIASDTWTLGPDAAIGRINLVGAVVGSKYYAFGGRSGSQVFADVEAYDTASGTWSAAAPMPTAREAMGLGILEDGVHVVGGNNTGPAALDVHEVYDPLTDTWSTRAPLPVAVTSCTATVALDGKLYVLGGTDGNLFVRDLTQIYDGATDSWTMGATFPFPERQDAVAGVLRGKVVLIGGDKGLTDSTLDDVDVYDPATDTWCEGPRIMIEAQGISAPAPHDESTIYTIGLRSGSRNPAVHQALVWEGPELTIACPGDVDLECPADTSVTATGEAVAAGGCAVPLTITFEDREAPGCGGTRTIVRRFRATDGGQAASCIQTIRVHDRTPPALVAGSLPACFPSRPDAEAAAVAATAASDACPGPLSLVASAAGGCAATVTVTASDGCGNASSLEYATRIDGVAPAILDLGPSHGTCLWPPNHRMVCIEDLAGEVTAEDDCPGVPRVTIADVQSDQPPDAEGDGNTEPDYELVGGPPASGACLRAERQGGVPGGRTYTVEVSATDACGNRATGFLEVRVPHDRGPDDGCRTSGR